MKYSARLFITRLCQIFKNKSRITKDNGVNGMMLPPGAWFRAYEYKCSREGTLFRAHECAAQITFASLIPATRLRPQNGCYTNKVTNNKTGLLTGFICAKHGEKLVVLYLAELYLGRVFPRSSCFSTGQGTDGTTPIGTSPTALGWPGQFCLECLPH